MIDRRTENARTLTRKLVDVPGLHPFTLDERITRCSYLSYSIRYESEELDGVHRDTFLKALATEGISMRTGYTTLVHEMPLCNGENLRPEDLKRFSGRNIDAATNSRPTPLGGSVKRLPVRLPIKREPSAYPFI